MHNAMERILLSEDQIQARIGELGRQLTGRLPWEESHFCGDSEGRGGVFCRYDPGHSH